MDLRNSEQLLRVFFFFNFLWAKKNNFFFRNILASVFLKKFEKIEKIGYHSNFSFDCNTERGFKESLSIALG